jgi:hypothetical protein
MILQRRIMNSLFKLFILILFFKILSATPVVVSGGPENDYESWIARLIDERLMIIFDRNPDWISGNIYTSFSTDNGKTWSSPNPVIVKAGDQATLSFVQLSYDTIRLWYASNENGNYGIYSASSMDGLSWTEEGMTNLGWSTSDMHYDPNVILESDSSLTMSYRGPNGGYITHCPKNSTWDTLKTLVASYAYRPRVMKHPNGTYLYAYHRKSGPGTYDYDVFIRTSADRINWSDSIRLTFNLNSHDPFPNLWSDQGYMVYYAKYENSTYNLYRRHSLNTMDWEPEEQITFGPNRKTQPHFFIENNNLFLVWAHCVTYPDDHDVYFEFTPNVSIKEKHINLLPYFKLYPNPCSEKIHIIMKNKQLNKFTITLYDKQGRVITLPESKSPLNNLFQSFDISYLTNGIYFVKLKNSNDYSLIYKFVVMH